MKKNFNEVLKPFLRRGSRSDGKRNVNYTLRLEIGSLSRRAFVQKLNTASLNCGTGDVFNE